MKDEDDTRDVLINKLFRFKLKKRFKDNKQSNYSPYEKEFLILKDTQSL